MATPLPLFAICPICHQPVDIANSKTDENGQAVHEDCYLDHLCHPLPPQD
jgi:hypothetical protein